MERPALFCGTCRYWQDQTSLEHLDDLANGRHGVCYFSPPASHPILASAIQPGAPGFTVVSTRPGVRSTERSCAQYRVRPYLVQEPLLETVDAKVIEP
jgi:hypothetical protein